MLSSISRTPLLEGKGKRCVEKPSWVDDWREGTPNNAKVVEEESRYYCVFLEGEVSTVITPAGIIKGVFGVEELKGFVAVEDSVCALGHSNEVLG
jgi:hypothetical protein